MHYSECKNCTVVGTDAPFSFKSCLARSNILNENWVTVFLIHFYFSLYHKNQYYNYFRTLTNAQTLSVSPTISLGLKEGDEHHTSPTPDETCNVALTRSCSLWCFLDSYHSLCRNSQKLRNHKYDSTRPETLTIAAGLKTSQCLSIFISESDTFFLACSAQEETTSFRVPSTCR